MIATLFLGAGLVLAIEGLVLALAPSYFEKMVAMMAEVPPDQRRVIGLTAVAIGVGVLWLILQ